MSQTRYKHKITHMFCKLLDYGEKIGLICCPHLSYDETNYAWILFHWINEPRHDKTNKVSVRPAKTQILGIRPVWSESSLSAWRNLGSLATHLAHSEDSDQTGRMPRLIWVFAGRTFTLLLFFFHVVAQMWMRWTWKKQTLRLWNQTPWF